MPRRFERQPKRYAAGRISREQTTTTNRDANIQEILTILGGVTGVVIAILWVAGRFYAAGYFGAMNIPAFQINFFNLGICGTFLAETDIFLFEKNIPAFGHPGWDFTCPFAGSYPSVHIPKAEGI